jgi:hypothetical protein
MLVWRMKQNPCALNTILNAMLSPQPTILRTRCDTFGARNLFAQSGALPRNVCPFIMLNTLRDQNEAGLLSSGNSPAASDRLWARRHPSGDPDPARAKFESGPGRGGRTNAGMPVSYRWLPVIQWEVCDL